jgi:hypothetical protein
MPDTTLSVKFVADDQITPAINNVKGQLNQLSAPTNQVAQSAREMGEAFRIAGVNLESMLTRMAVRMGIMLVAHEAIRLLIQAYQEWAREEQEIQHIQAITQQSLSATRQEFTELRLSAEYLGLDLQKQVVPSYMKLLEAGYSAQQADAMIQPLLKDLKQTGIDLTDVAIKADEGTASFKELAKAFGGLGQPEMAQWARQWEVATEAEKDYNRELEHYDRLLKEAHDDQQRLTDAQMGFASSAGLVKAAVRGTFGEFQGSAEQLKAAQQAELSRLARGPAGRALGAQFGKGIEEIAKEEGLTRSEIQTMLQLKMISGEELISAAKRYDQEKQTALERQKQETQYQRTKAFDDARLNANRELTALLDKQAADMDRIVNASQMLARMRFAGPPAAAPEQQMRFAGPPIATPEQQMRFGGPPPPTTEQQMRFAKDESIKELTNEVKGLKTMLQGH